MCLIWQGCKKGRDTAEGRVTMFEDIKQKALKLDNRLTETVALKAMEF